MAKLANCIVTNVTEGAAFAIREDTDENVYISAAMSRELQLEVFDRLRGVLVGNQNQPDRTPWMMARAQHIDEQGEPIEYEDAS